MLSLPKDPVLLLSVVNTALRDEFDSLEELCKTQNAAREDLESALAAIDYHYDPQQNRFV